MPWYLFYADHGPGHQSHTSKTIWFESDLTQVQASDEWDGIFGRQSYDYPIGSYARLEGLTGELLISKRKHYQDQIDSVNRMLKILDETAAIQHKPLKSCKGVCTCGKRCYTCLGCGKVYCYSFHPDFGVCPHCMVCPKGGKHDWDMVNLPEHCRSCGVEHPNAVNWAKQREAAIVHL